MNLTKSRIISTITIFILCFFIHFGYDILPNPVSAIFFPVNESIWEHMKMLYTAIIFNGLIDYFIMKKFKINFNNFFLNLFVTATISIPIYLVMYLPFYYKIGPKMILNISTLFITILITQIISFYILKRNNIKKLNTVSFILIMFNYIVFGYLTYYPIQTDLFFDSLEEKYGLNTYRITSQEPNR